MELGGAIARPAPLAVAPRYGSARQLSALHRVAASSARVWRSARLRTHSRLRARAPAAC